MKKEFYIYIICLVLLISCGYLFYDKLNSDEICAEQQNINKETKEIVSDYKNYTKITEQVLNSQNKYKRLDLEIVDGKLIANLNYQSLDVKEIKGKVKSFVISRDYCSDDANKWLIVINDQNELYMTDINYYDKSNYMTFKKISLNDEIKDITDLDFNVGFSTCGRVNTAVVLKDNTIHQLIYDREKNTFIISKTDVSNFKTSIGSTYIVYKDNTIGRFDTYGKYENEFNERLKYNNKELKASIIYESVENDEMTSYIVSDNRLYKVENTYDGPQVKVSKVSLVNDKRITVMMTKASSNVNYRNIEITFEDDTTFTIKNVTMEYVID